MHRYLYSTMLLAILPLISCDKLAIPGTPAYTPIKGCYQDYAKILSRDTKDTILEVCKNLKEDSNTNLALVTVPTLGKHSATSYAAVLVNTWETQEQDNVSRGVLVFVAPNDSGMRIELSKEINLILSNKTAKRLIDQKFVPYFREKKYDQGMVIGIQALADWIRTH